MWFYFVDYLRITHHNYEYIFGGINIYLFLQQKKDQFVIIKVEKKCATRLKESKESFSIGFRTVAGFSYKGRGKKD